MPNSQTLKREQIRLSKKSDRLGEGTLMNHQPGIVVETRKAKIGELYNLQLKNIN